MARHETFIVRSGEGLIGKCSCKQRQTKPVLTEKEAEDWGIHHLQQVARAQADPGHHLSERAYLAHLEKMATEAPTKRDRELWERLAEEHRRRMKSGAAGPKGDLPMSPNAKYNTGVETEPLF